MIGCHNCEHAGEKFASYEESPCSKCPTEKDPPLIAHYAADPALFSNPETMHPAYTGADEKNRLQGALSALAQCVRRLVSLKETNPTTYNIVSIKLEEPELSYSQIADRLKCRKQNIMYHLKKAVGIFPELSEAIMVDTRFLGGRPSIINKRMQGAVA